MHGVWDSDFRVISFPSLSSQYLPLANLLIPLSQYPLNPQLLTPSLLAGYSRF